MTGAGDTGRVIALCGGVGGGKLAHGLSRRVAAEDLTIIVNTGDDFEHLGLPISPDIDTVVYTLAGLANRQLGWGREDESWAAFEELRALGGADWFQLGDRDLALHLVRRQMRDAGHSLSEITAHLAARLGVGPRIVPMTDDPVRTMVATDEGVLTFQRYFVGRKCEPRVNGIAFDGVDAARPATGVTAAFADPDLAAVIICPSNPFLSVDPILSVPGMRSMLADTAAPVVAVTPLIGGAAVKGPTAKICDELGVPSDPVAIAAHYDGLLNGFVLDARDSALAGRFPESCPLLVADTLMVDDARREALAGEVLDFARSLRVTGKGNAT